MLPVWAFDNLDGFLASQVPVYGMGGGSIEIYHAFPQYHAPIADRLDSMHVMADKKYCSPFFHNLGHLPQAFVLKLRIAHRQHLVHDQNFRIQVRRHGERQAHVHAAAVVLHRRVEERVHLREGDDLVH